MRTRSGAAEQIAKTVASKTIATKTIAKATDTEAFSLYDAEEAVLAKTTAMLTGLADMAGDVESLAEAYRRSYREQKRLVRMSDRMQSDLQKANHCLAEQRGDLQALNEVLSGEISHRTRLEAELRRLADMDDLTGAYARRRFLEIGEREWIDHRQSGSPVCVMMLDLDRFKRLNDGHGHAAGDAALIAFVAICRSALRIDDVIGRMGGEEFAVLLPGTSRGDGLAIAESLRAAVAATEIAWEGTHLSLSVSIGLTAAEGTVSLAMALRQADAALYFAKNTGRNCVCDAADCLSGIEPGP